MLFCYLTSTSTVSRKISLESNQLDLHYTPPLWLRNGHLSTIYPSFFRKQDMAAFRRITITTPDDDFLDVDVLAAGHKRAVLLCHGLEGSSQSQYIHGNARLLSGQNWDILAMNYRFCSGRINKQLTLYHSGATYDLDTVIQYFLPQYDEIVLVGFSLGGNLVLKYCGERGTSLNPKVRKAVAISRLLYTSPSPRDRQKSRMPSSA